MKSRLWVMKSANHPRPAPVLLGGSPRQPRAGARPRCQLPEPPIAQCCVGPSVMSWREALPVQPLPPLASACVSRFTHTCVATHTSFSHLSKPSYKITCSHKALRAMPSSYDALDASLHEPGRADGASGLCSAASASRLFCLRNFSFESRTTLKVGYSVSGFSQRLNEYCPRELRF